jgi:hypothetical protein
VSWEIILVPEVHDWYMALDDLSADLVRDAVELLAERGPTLGRPMADRITGSSLHNLKELRPGSVGRTEIRILYVFDLERRAVFLVAGDTKPATGVVGTGTLSSWPKAVTPGSLPPRPRRSNDEALPVGERS